MDYRNLKILISIPCRDTLSVRFLESLMNLAKPCACYYKFGTSGLVYDARDEACQVAINEEYDYILFVDSDMIMAPDALVKALNRNLDIVTGLYFKRRDSHDPVIYKSIGKRELLNGGTVVRHAHAIIERDIFRDLFEVEGCGFGFVLIRTSVLKAMHRKSLSWFEPLPGMGEDLSFCERCKDIDVKIMCDTSFYLGHIGEYVYDVKDWRPKENSDGVSVDFCED